MSLDKIRKKSIFLVLIWIIEGIVVGFDAILPGISGGTLCVAFGMYRPIIETISNLKSGLKKHGFMLSVFFAGITFGFIGLSGLAAWLMSKNTALITCSFIGFIIGTFPDLWKEAGIHGRKKSSYISMTVCFIAMLAVLTLFRTKLILNIEPDTAGYLLCGLLWGLSFIVPGLSSSTLLLFFGLYQPMLTGISVLDFGVLIPIAIGMVVCVLLLSKAIGYAYKKQYSIISHGVLGIVIATALMIFPTDIVSLPAIALNITVILGGAIISFCFTRICNKLKTQRKEEKI